MNHTIRGIIIVVAITSMLFVGATSMFPIMQNSFARSTNINTNTNSADSSSSSDATASNTNNINNTATASSNQNQNACAVALTCPEGTTTVAPTPPTTGTLEITKVCTSSACSGFLIIVTGNNPQPSSPFTLRNGQTQDVTLGPGMFAVAEAPPATVFIPTFTGDCKQTSPGSFVATGTISAGQTLHCTITNTPA